ncbi:MAG: hypothetical protein U9R27_01085 [Campylobacterota bacterium]|nr:hypothetical protein [Campylobacterota bacterium]
MDYAYHLITFIALYTILASSPSTYFQDIQDCFHSLTQGFMGLVLIPLLYLVSIMEYHHY